MGIRANYFMKKWIIYLILMFVMIPIVIAELTECTGVMDSSDVPCLVISTWQFPNNCNTYNIQVYNKTPINIQNLTMGDYGLSGRCNVTFNQTKIGSYLLNWSSGDSSKIIIEVDDMNFIAIGLMLGIVTFIFAFLATKVKHWALQISLSLFTMVMVVFDFFISARIIEIVDSAQTGMIYYLDTFFKIGVTLFRFALAGTVIFLIYYMYKHILVNPVKKRQEREEEGIYG